MILIIIPINLVAGGFQHQEWKGAYVMLRKVFFASLIVAGGIFLMFQICLREKKMICS